MDDHADTLTMLARLLRMAGHEVYSAADATAARRIAAAHPIDVLVSDLGLPGESGLDLMRELRAAYGLRGVAVSGYAAAADAAAALAAGFDRHLAKPHTLPDLLAAIRQAVAEPAPAEGAGSGAGVYRAVVVGTDGRDVIAFVRRPDGGCGVLRDGAVVGTWGAADGAAGLRQFDAMIAGAPPLLPPPVP